MSRTIVITGGTSGIGLALKELFEKNGDNVYTFSLDESDSQNHYQGSVSHEIKVNQVFNDIHEKHNNIDMLINCAGFGMSAITEIAPMEKINNVMDVNFYGTLFCTRAALRYMNVGARIVNLSSAMALFPVPFKSIYGAAKSAVLNLSLSMKMELAPAGIDVVAICPGDTKTNFTKNRIKEFETTERYGERLKTATEHNDSKEDKRMPVSYVAEQIYKVINKEKTKPFYIIGGKYKFLYFLTRITPKSLLISLTGKKLGGKMEEITKKKATKADIDSETIQEDEESTTIEEPASLSTLNKEETTETENTSTNEAEVDKASKVETETKETSISQEEAKNNISNILNKITILNKPTEVKQQTQEETKNIDVSKENTPSTSESNTSTETVNNTSDTNTTTKIETQPIQQIDPTVTNETASVEKQETTPIIEKNEPTPTQQTKVVSTQVVASQPTQATQPNSQQTVNQNTEPVQQQTTPSTTPKNETVVPHIQFDDEE